MTSDPNEVDALEALFPRVVERMEVRFTSHQFFLRLAHDHQREYVAGLAAYAEGGTPFKDLHHALVKRLKKLKDARRRSLSRDMEQYREINERKRETGKFQSRGPPRRPNRGPGRER